MDVVCPVCGLEMEFFSDDLERLCECGKTVKRDGTPAGKVHEHANRPFEVVDDPQAHKQVEDIRHQVENTDRGE